MFFHRAVTLPLPFIVNHKGQPCAVNALWRVFSKHRQRGERHFHAAKPSQKADSSSEVHQ
jgi:hypothetical protein